MANYKEMYISLFKAVTESIELLQIAQQKTEEMYISEETVIKMFDPNKNKNNSDDENKPK